MNLATQSNRTSGSLTPDLKDKIDRMYYVSMLRSWRFSLSGDILFQGEVGEYFKKIMLEKRNALPRGAHAYASKLIGW